MLNKFFGKSEGGLLDTIRCDQRDYFIWKWRPSGGVNTTKKENSIRYGSSLRVKDGEVAVFVYRQADNSMQDFIVGPHDQTIKTANFPVLSSLVGSAFGGNSPFQAEVYFINLAGNAQVKFGIPYFDVFDPRFDDFAVPMATRGTITLNITDYAGFIKLNRLIDFSTEDFRDQIRDAVTKYVKSIVSNTPSDAGIPVLQMERKLLEINGHVHNLLKPRLEDDFGVNLKDIDIAVIEPDKQSQGYRELRKVTADQAAKTIDAQTDINIKNLAEAQDINSENTRDSLRINREESQRAQKLDTEGRNMNAHQLNQQTDVAKTAAESLGKMGSGMGGTNGEGGSSGFDPASTMAAMTMGGAVGQSMARSMGGMMDGVSEKRQTPPPPPTTQWFLYHQGQQIGPLGQNQVKQLIDQNQVSEETHAWKDGMEHWEKIANIGELSSLIRSTPTPPPPPTE
ncbi:SPFH domain-containing protein [Marinobacter segnicrescens]|uniref:SPFH domain-containing protein n=1 Tax=Marinobacter segnicrescens TaxID=430453 RepID=UPI003A95BFC8